MATFTSTTLPYFICILFAFSYLVVSINGESFVKTQGTEFVVDGHPFLFNGFNSYWMMHVAADPSERNKVTDVFSKAAANGLTVCRTWAFNDGGDRALQLSPGVYDERVFEVMKSMHVISSVECCIETACF